MNCPCSEWEEIGEFSYPKEYDDFVKWIESHIASGNAAEVPVANSYGGFKERWFQCRKCGKKWRLVEYDFPFKGLFAPVAQVAGK